MARGILGLCMGPLLPPVFISRTVAIQRRSEIMFYFSAVNTLGYAAGPALAAIIEVFVKSLRIENLVLDSDTAPGWFMAMMYLFFMVMVIVLFDDLPIDDATPSANGSGKEQRDRIPLLGAAACLWTISVAGIITTSCEIYAVFIGQHHWGWSIESTAWYLAALMLLVGLFNMFLGRFTTSVLRSDRAGIVAASALGIIFGIPLFDFGTFAVSAQATLLGVGSVLTVFMAGTCRSFGLALATKMAPPELKVYMNLYASMAMPVGRGAGALIGSVLSPTSFAWCMMGLYVFTLIFTAACYSKMTPHEKAD